jgi:hypothetical protein
VGSPGDADSVLIDRYLPLISGRELMALKSIITSADKVPRQPFTCKKTTAVGLKLEE